MSTERNQPLSQQEIFDRVDRENRVYFISTTINTLLMLSAPFIALRIVKENPNFPPLDPATERAFLQVLFFFAVIPILTFPIPRVSHLRRVRQELTEPARQLGVRVDTRLGGFLGLNAEVDYRLLYE